MGLVVIHGTIVFLSTLVFVGAGYEFLPALFDVTSSVSTVGLSAGVVDPSLAPRLKGFLILLMWMGRVETFPVLMLYYGILRRKGYFYFGNNRTFLNWLDRLFFADLRS